MSGMTFYGTLITIIVFLVCIISIFVALSIYRPHLKLLRFISMIVVMALLLSTASIQVLASYGSRQPSNDDDETNLLDEYKLTHWAMEESSPSTVLHLKHAWEDAPNETTKTLYALTLLKNLQIEQGKKHIEELIQYSEDEHEWIDVEALTVLLEEVEQFENTQADSTEEIAGEPPYAVMIDEQLNAYKQSIADALSLEFEILEMITKFDIDRIQMLASSGEQEKVNDIQNELSGFSQQLLDASSEHAMDDPFLLKVFAQSNIFFGNHQMAERLLLKSIKEQAYDDETIALLSEIYLSGRITPSEEVKQLPQYHHAQMATAREKIANYESWVHQGSESEQVDSEVADDHLSRTNDVPEFLFEDDQTLTNELTYTLLETAREPDQAHLKIRKSRYHYNKGENQEAKETIQEVIQKQEQLSREEQYIINAIQYHEQKLQHSSDLSFPDRQVFLQEIYDAKENLYRSFHTPSQYGGKTTADESFEHFVTETIRQPEDQTLSIMTIDASDDGEVAMFINTENIDQLSKNGLTITDNEHEITDFTLEKLGEGSTADGIARSIGLVMDVSGSMQGDRIAIARNASTSFIANMKDFEQGELVSFSGSPTLVQSMTSNKQSLIRGVSGLTADGNTNITDALIFELERLKNQPGHKVLFIFSDGEDEVFSEVSSRSRVIDLANRYGVSIFAVGFGAGYETLSEVAQETGGAYIAAPNEATINEGFNYIEQLLSSTYKITYQLEDPEEGKHTVRVLYQDLFDEKDYYIGRSEEDLPGNRSGFTIYDASPNVIYQESSGSVQVTLNGQKLSDVTSITIGDHELGMDIIDDETIEVTVPAHLTLGNHLIVAQNKLFETATTEVTIVEATPQDSIQFGWATIYADRCEPSGEEIKCVGRPNIDKFMYADGSTMTVTNDESVSFNGASFNVNQTKLFFFKNDFQPGEALMTGELVMTKADDYGETFSLRYEGRDRISLNKLGIKIDLNNMTYTAVRDDRPGTLKSVTTLNGVPGDVFKVINTEGSTVLSTLAPFLSARSGLELTISSNTANIKGNLELGNLKYLGIEMKQPVSEFEYDDMRKRFAIKGSLGKLEFLGFSVGDFLPINSANYDLGYEPGFKFRIGVTLNGNLPLGNTGISLKKVGALVDWTSRREAGLEVGLGTIVSKPLEEFAKKISRIKIAKIKLFDIDPKDFDLFAVDLKGNVTGALTPHWDAKGTASGKVLGFEVLNVSGRMTPDLLQGNVSLQQAVDIEGENTIVYRDPNYANRLGIYTRGGVSKSILGFELAGELYSRVILSNISNSELRVTGRLGPWEFSVSTDSLNLFN